jgi:hypothetical protein
MLFREPAPGSARPEGACFERRVKREGELMLLKVSHFGLVNEVESLVRFALFLIVFCDDSA